MTQNVGEFLVSKGLLEEARLKEALTLQSQTGQQLEECLVRLGAVDETTLARARAKIEGMPFVDLDKGRVSSDILDRVPAEIAREQGIVPLKIQGEQIIVAIDDPFKRIVADQLQFILGLEVRCALATPSAHRRAVERYYGNDSEDSVAATMGVSDEDEDDAPIIRLVTRLFQDAMANRASDIHIEPCKASLRIRFRVDGMLRDVADHPEHLTAPVISRLKIMAKMDIAEKRKPQDGRISVMIDGREIDVRASVLPTNYGESIVMRLLDRSASLISLKELGFSDENFRWFQKQIARPHGIVLVTGPTGSGKTTTLYAALSELNRPDVKIITAEDPVEYHLSGINQVQVQPKIGLSFARILKAMLRAAPNVILVGEIRDLETAEIAIQAALTGHLVFSTLHTNDAPSALTRLQDMGVKPFLVSAAVQSVIAQRLVRRLCSECAEEYKPEDAEVRTLGLDPSLLAGQRFKRPRGCRTCEGTGYRGRVALYELMVMDHSVREMTVAGASVNEIKSSTIASGNLQPLQTDGAQKVLSGLTSTTEVLRVTRVIGLEEGQVL